MGTKVLLVGVCLLFSLTAASCVPGVGRENEGGSDPFSVDVYVEDHPMGPSHQANINNYVELRANYTYVNLYSVAPVRLYIDGAAYLYDERDVRQKYLPFSETLTPYLGPRESYTGGINGSFSQYYAHQIDAIRWGPQDYEFEAYATRCEIAGYGCAFVNRPEGHYKFTVLPYINSNQCCALLGSLAEARE